MDEEMKYRMLLGVTGYACYCMSLDVNGCHQMLQYVTICHYLVLHVIFQYIHFRQIIFRIRIFHNSIFDQSIVLY